MAVLYYDGTAFVHFSGESRRGLPSVVASLFQYLYVTEPPVDRSVVLFEYLSFGVLLSSDWLAWLCL